MPDAYTSIRNHVLSSLEAHLPDIRSRFGIETIGIFGSVSRGEDTSESDVDVLYTFLPEYDNYHTFFDLAEYLELLFQRKVDLVSPAYLKPRIKPYV
ncbi:MAG: nucleotidyltransferase family protein, partial [Methanocorpusculum sp.]|nr:nucleotidyltransferase family protein [Methanocorpusculum sp.]